MLHYLCFLGLFLAVNGHSELNKDAAALVPALLEDELDGMALVCFPGSQCTQFPASVVFDALARELEGIQREEKRSGYLFRSRRGFDDDEEDADVEKRGGSHGYLLRTRKSEEAEPTTRNTRGSYLFRTRKSDPTAVVPERNSRGAGYLFRTRKSVDERTAAAAADLLNNEEAGFDHEMMNRMLRSSKGYLFRTRKSAESPMRNVRGGSYLFRT